MPSNHGDIRAGDWISSSVCTNRKPWQTGITDRSFWSVLLDLLISSISCNFAMGLQGHEINSCLKQDDLQCSKHVSLSLQCSKYSPAPEQFIMQMNINSWWTGVCLVFEAYWECWGSLGVATEYWHVYQSPQVSGGILSYSISHTATSAIKQPLTYEQEIELTVVPIEILGRQETPLDLLIIRVSCKFAMA